MKYQIQNLFWDFCGQDCLRRNACNATDTVIKNIRACGCCTALNLELLVVMSGGQLPEKKQKVVELIPTVWTMGNSIEIRGQRQESRQSTNELFFEFIRSRRLEVGPHADAQVLAHEAAYVWSFASEEERANFEEPTTYSTPVSFGTRI